MLGSRRRVVRTGLSGCTGKAGTPFSRHRKRRLGVPADAWVGTPRPRRVSFGIASDASAVDSGPVAYEFKLPDLGEGLTEGEIARWLVAEGQEIAEDDPLVEIQTDKTTVEIPSPAAGKVARILVAEGETVAVGTVLVVIGEDGVTAAVGEQPRAEEPPPASAVSPGLTPGHGPPGRVRATPLVRRLAQE